MATRSIYDTSKDPKNGLYAIKEYNTKTVGYKPTNRTPKPYEDPLTKYKPVLHKYKEYKPKVQNFEYKPYNSFHVYVPPDIDPLTGKPRVRYKRTKKPQTPPPPPSPELKTQSEPNLPSAVGSMKRTFKIQQDLRYV